MIRRSLNASIRFRVAVAAAAVAVLGAGAMQLSDAPRDVYPEFDPPTVEIQTEALGLSAAEVEQLITAPLEADLLNGVAWVDDIQSESVLGLSSVTMVFEPGTDLYRARQAVQERLAQAHALPNVSKPPQMLQPKSSSSRTMMIGLGSSSLSLIELSQLARWTVKPRLQGVEGVANVTTFGNRERQLQVQVDPQKLADKNVTLQQVVESTGNSLWVSPLTFLEASTPGTGGFIETQNQRLGIRHVSPIESAADLAKIAIVGTGGAAAPGGSGSGSGPTLTLADVATVVEDHQPLIGDAQLDSGQGIILVVEKLREANTVEVTEGIEAALANLKPALRDVTVDTSIYQPAKYVRAGSDNLTKTVAAGGILALALLLLLFLSWRAAVVVAAAVSTSLLGAVLVLLWRGESLNMLVLAGLAVALAVVVDDAVSATDRIVRRLRDAGPDAPVASTIVSALGELRGALAFATVFVLLPVLPAFFMDDLFGYFGRPLAISYGLAVLVSMLAALTVTPALAALLFRNARQAGTASRASAGLERRYTAGLGRAVVSKRKALTVTAVLAVVGFAALPALASSEMPGLDERDFLIELDGPPGASLAEMNRMTAAMAAELKAIPGVRSVASHAGRAITGDQVKTVSSAEMWVGLDDSASPGRATKAMKAALGNYPTIDADLMTYQQYALKDVGSHSDGDLVVRVYGHNEAVLAEKASELGRQLDRIDGVSGLTVELPIPEKTLEVEVNLEKAAEYGVKPGDVRRSAALLLAGVEVGALYYDQRVFEVVVWGTPEVRKNPTDVRNLLIETPNKGLIPLSEVAEVRDSVSPNVIEREGAFRRIDIIATVTGRGVDAVASEMRTTIANTSFPLEYRAELLGDYVEQSADDNRLMLLGGFALLSMLLLLQACFGSWRLGTLLFITLPVSLTGGLFAAFAAAGSPSVGATVGLIAVLGLATRNGIVLLRRCQQLQRREGVEFGPELVATAARERLAPTVISAVVTAAAFLPVLVIGDGAGHELLYPMAVVVLCGLLTATAVSLFVVPLLYLLIGSRVTATEADMLLFDDEERTQADFVPMREPALVGSGSGMPDAPPPTGNGRSSGIGRSGGFAPSDGAGPSTGTRSNGRSNGASGANPGF